jgi:signal transduction histidine kinase
VIPFPPAWPFGLECRSSTGLAEQDQEAADAKPAPARTMKTWAWRGYLAAGVVAGALYFLLEERDAVWVALGVSAAAATVVGVRWHRPATPLAWYLLAAGLLTFVLGDALYDLFVRFSDGPVPYPSVADLLYLATYVFLISGLLLILRARTAGRDRAGLLDALAVATGAGMLVWLLLIVPYVRAPELTLPQRLTSIGYPVADLLLLTVVARLWVGGGSRPPAYHLLLAGAVGTLAADAAFGYIQLVGEFDRGGPVDLGWIVFYLAWGTAALHPSMAALSRPAPTGPTRLTRGRLALLTGVCLVAPAVLVLQWLRREPIDALVIAGGSMVLFLIGLARMRDLATEVAAQVERRRVLDRIVEAAEHERARVAGELHDGPVQQLTALVLHAGRALRQLDDGDLDGGRVLVERIEGGLQEQIGSLRRTMAALRPAPLDDCGLEVALRDELTAVAGQAELGYDFDAHGVGRLARDAETVLYRVAQESLTNVLKHANASNVTVTLRNSGGTVQLVVCDDGVGFAPEEPAKLRHQGRFGLIGMQERVALAGGKLHLRSAPGAGTTVEALLPYVPAGGQPH